ncbi:MAG: thioredoxin domain-containing protein [Bacteroidota bacterium]
MRSFLKAAAVFQLSFILFSCTAQEKNDLSADEFEKGISNKDSVQILDVRTAKEYAVTHIKGSLLADWNNKEEFNHRIAFVDKSKPVYVYCLAGSRSAAAAKQMRNAGFQNVYELNGGINAWKAANKSLEGKSDKKQMTVDEFNAVINSDKVVLVDFGAEWCPPCKKMEPVLKSLETKGKFKLLKVDGGNDEDLLKAYNITALPVFIIFKDGKQVWRKDGVAEEAEFVKNL